MKKLVFMLFFVFTASSINANGTINNGNSDCKEYAKIAALSEAIRYNHFASEFKAAYEYYYDACIDAEGSISQPTFLN